MESREWGMSGLTIGIKVNNCISGGRLSWLQSIGKDLCTLKLINLRTYTYVQLQAAVWEYYTQWSKLGVGVATL